MSKKANAKNFAAKIARKGFTLIELMIVIGIVGILAIIALPQYNNYVARSQATEAVNILGGSKVVIAEFVSTNGRYPTQAELHEIYPIITTDTGSVASSTKYLDAVTVGTANIDGTDRFTLTAKFKSANVNAKLESKSIVFHTPVASATGAGTSWECRGDISAEALPSACKSVRS
ncbi:MAG: hypothetical protein RLZZ210_1263 [Pseudomonadota bacterium]|jgi:type IV pilus assembly protein PilA